MSSILQEEFYLDNIRWMTVVLVVIYHVVYMYNGVQPFGVIGPFRKHQLQDCFSISGLPLVHGIAVCCVRDERAIAILQSHTTKQFLKDKTRKLLVTVHNWLVRVPVASWYL